MTFLKQRRPPWGYTAFPPHLQTRPAAIMDPDMGEEKGVPESEISGTPPGRCYRRDGRSQGPQLGTPIPRISQQHLARSGTLANKSTTTDRNSLLN